MARKNNKFAQAKKGSQEQFRKRRPMDGKDIPSSEKSDRNMDRDSDRSYGGNHISWYVPDQNLLADVASIPFNYRTGDPYIVTNELADQTVYVPGVVSVRYVPTYGTITSPNDPVNVAATAAYSWIRHANSGSRNYDAPDLMLYLMAMDSVYSGITWLQRSISMLNCFNAQSRYFPNGILKACGIDVEAGQVFGKLPYYRAWLNNLILRATTLAVPRTLPLYERHAFMNSNVYSDEPNGKAQMYVFNPDYLYKFQLNTDGSGMLAATQFMPDATSVQTLDTFFGIVQSCIDAIYGDEDAGIMSGDILKAYGANGIFKLVTVPEDLVLVPVYDRDFLEQIHNATIVGEFLSGDITQHLEEVGSGLTSYLQQTLLLLDDYKNSSYPGSTAGIVQNGPKFLDIHQDPTPEVVMKATRFMMADFIAGTTGSSPTLQPTAVGTEIVTAARLYTFEGTASNPTLSAVGFGGTFLSAAAAVSRISRAMQVSYWPLLYLWETQPNDHYGMYLLGNTDRMTLLSVQNIRQLHQVAMLGVFNVPRLTLGFTDNA